VGEFKTPLSPMHRSPRQNKQTNKETLELNDIVDQMNLKDIYIIFHLITTEHTFFSGAMERSPKYIF
jgi:hypothetical protein